MSENSSFSSRHGRQAAPLVVRLGAAVCLALLSACAGSDMYTARMLVIRAPAALPPADSWAQAALAQTSAQEAAQAAADAMEELMA